MTRRGVSADDEGRALLAVARLALRRALDLPSAPLAEGESGTEPGASFVTLRLSGQLRGCIGTVDAFRPLAEDVRKNAVAAAFRDPRFPPLTVEEVEDVRIEVSILGPPERLEIASEEDLMARLRPGRDGLLLEHGLHRGTFLPAVWRSIPEPAEFVRQLKRKAGLPADFWADDLKIWRYSTTTFSEDG